MNTVQRGLLVAALMGTSCPMSVIAEEAPPFKLIVVCDTKTIPPLASVPFVMQLKNVTSEEMSICRDWYDLLYHEVYRDNVLLSEGIYAHVDKGGGGVEIKPSEAIGYIVPLHSIRCSTPFFKEPGEYVLKTRRLVDYEHRLDQDDNIITDSIVTIELATAPEDIKITVRPATEAEAPALELLRQSPEAVAMLRDAPSEKGSQVLKQIVERHPGTIYADQSNYALGINTSIKDATGQISEQETIQERVKYLSKVGTTSNLLHNLALYKRYVFMISYRKHFADTDWKAVLKELEALQGTAKMLGQSEAFTTVYLPLARMYCEKEVPPATPATSTEQKP